MQLLGTSLIELLLEKEEGEEDYYPIDSDIPTFKINLLLLIFKTYNLLLHMDHINTQLYIECTSALTQAISVAFEYSKDNFK